MEHRNSDSAKDNGGMFTGLLQMYNRGSQMASQGCFSVTNSGNFIPQRPAACHKTESPVTSREGAYGSDLSDYMERFPTNNDSSNQILASDISSRMGCQHDAPFRMTSETLLDAISLAQRRLQHLEAIVRMMITGRAVPQMAQQYHSLSMEFTSIMSQLSAATAAFSSLPPFQVSPPIAPLANDNFDFGFDAFNEDDFKNVLGDGSVLPCPPTSGMDVLLSGFGRGVGLCLPSWTTDERVSPVGPMASSDELGNMFTAVLVQGNGDKCPLEKEALGNPPESGKARDALEGDCLTPISIEEQREEEDDGESENLPPGSYELVELAATEILAEHTHFCEICGKGFKRDANLRMHMRGHGDEYKTAAALARPDKLPRASSVMKPRRYSCPYTGCKRNKQHPKFQPLKTMLCVKNHYRRSHCPKILVCSRCKAKKFSVNADLKTHEKHCGQDRWQCSCGTTFSRKDKLYGHVGLFAGHTPATLVQDKPDSHGSGLEALTSSGTNAAGMPVNLTKDNVKTNYVNGSQELVPAMVVSVHESENSLREQSSKESEKGAASSNSKGGLFCQARGTD